MNKYRYRAIKGGGEVVQGMLTSADPAAAAAALQRRGLVVLKLLPTSSGLAFLNRDIGGPARLRSSELADLTRELASMLGAGQDLDRSLRLMTDWAPNQRIGAIMGRVRDHIRDGMALANALQKEPRSFSRLYIGLVRAGEAGGDLAGTLERLAGMLDRERSLKATIIAAMTYPAILVLAAIGSITLLLTKVLPQFVPLFTENGVPLPASTAFLLQLGQLVSAYGLDVVGLIVALGFAIRYALRRPKLRLAADTLVLRVPVYGGLAREIIATHFARTLGMLLINGVPLLAALDVVQAVLGNLAARGAVAAAATAAKSGQGISGALDTSAVFPPRLVQLLRLGENTAQLGPLALRAADIHEERTRLAVQRVVALLVPAITLLMGAAVAGIVSSLLLAMLSLNDIAQ